MKRFHDVSVILIIAIITLVPFLYFTPANAQQANRDAESKVTFQWAFGSIKNTSSGPQFEVITRDTTLKTGDQIKFYIKVENKCFVYLIYQSSQGDLSVLFPYRFKLMAKDDYTTRHYYIPKGERWFELDEVTGTERFYLLASAERLNDLEAFVNQYESVDKVNKTGLGGKVITEIRKLRRQHRKFKAYAEKPVNIIGNMRGTEKTKAVGLNDLADHAVEISAKFFFSRTFTIDHK